MKTRILLIPVNYNSYTQLEDYIKSCEIAYEKVQQDCELLIKIADNSTVEEEINFECGKLIDIEIYKNNNIGYLGGAFEILNRLPSLIDYTFIIISNVDIKLDSDFFKILLTKHYKEEVGWIAPMIFSIQENRDKNPKILNRYSKKKLDILQLLYKYPVLHKLYTSTLYRRKKLRPILPPQEIYAGHGSIMIFMGTALEKLRPLNYPIFLFGEECFMAEILNRIGYKVFYDPAIKVLDQEHASTGSMKSDFYYRCNEEAIRYLKSEFYE